VNLGQKYLAGLAILSLFLKLYLTLLTDLGVFGLLGMYFVLGVGGVGVRLLCVFLSGIRSKPNIWIVLGKGFEIRWLRHFYIGQKPTHLNFWLHLVLIYT
jgi:hypothetical protein